jgi:hypothetical protein
MVTLSLPRRKLKRHLSLLRAKYLPLLNLLLWFLIPFKATIAALGIPTDNHRISPAHTNTVSGDCKVETGVEHAEVIQTVVNGVNLQKVETNIRIVLIALDGESRSGVSFSLLTFKSLLQ